MMPGPLNMEDLRWLRALGKNAKLGDAPQAVLSKLLLLKLAIQGAHRIEVTAKGRIAVKVLG